MNAKALYDELKSRQVELWCQGKMLRFRAPDGVLDDAMMAELRKHKKELIELVKGEENGTIAEVTNQGQLEDTTLGQQAMYFLHLSAPYSPAYNVASAFRISSSVNVDAVQSALRAIINRHDALRSTFEMKGGNLKRRINESPELDFAIIDVSSAGETELKEIVRREYQRPFELSSGPLIRTRLFKKNDQDFVFLMVLHHIIFDAWSLWVVQEEFHKVYAELHEGAGANLLPVGASFSEFVQRQKTLVESERGKELIDYWRGELAGELPTLNLPLDFARPQRPGLRGTSHKFRIPGSLSQRLREVAKSLRVTPFVLTLSIFKVLLHRICGQDDLIVGTTTSGRLQSDLARSVGYFVNSLAIRTQVEHSLTFAEYTGLVKKKVLGAIKNQDYPFAAIVDQLGSKRESGRAPVCSVMFGLQKPRFGEAARLFNETSEVLDLGGWRVTPFELDQQEGQFDLVLELFETEDSFLGLLKYDTELFSEETVRRIGDQYLTLANAIAANPALRIDEYELLNEADKKQLLQFSKGPELKFETGNTVLDLVREQVYRHPDRTAVACDDTQLSYLQLHQRSNQVSRLLKASGVSVGDTVACCFERCIEVPVLILGIMKAGAAYLPLDTTHPPQRLVQLIRDSGCRFVVADDCLSAESHDEIDVPILDVSTLESQLEEFDQNELGVNVLPSTTAYILYTSGSTGIPKGVCVPHQAFYAHILSIRTAFGIEEADRVLQFSNITFDPSLEQLFAPWSVGATVVMRGNELWSPESLCEMVKRFGLTVINLPPAYFKHCASMMTTHGNTESLRLVILGGDVFPVDSAKSFSGSGIRIINAYGPTEAVITSTVFDASGKLDGAKAIPIGRPKPGSRAYVLDNRGRMVPIGVPGRLFLAGPMLASGYLNDKALSVNRFVPDSYAGYFQESDSARMYDTGDVARWNPDGNLEFLGRADRQIKIYGMRVETGEIEAALNACDGVKHSHVDVRNNGEQSELVAWLVAEAPDTSDSDGTAPTGAVLDSTAIQRRLQSELPKFMIPRHYVFLSELPLNTSGKIDTTQLPEPQISVRRANVGQYVSPKTSWEITLANIWAEELKVSPVGVEDNFFDLGGASLSSLRIVSRMNEEGLNPTDQPLKPEMLFEFQTIRELATRLLAVEQPVAADR